jgi:hypothetical protein
MAKSKKAAPTAVPAQQGSELIVVMQSDAGLRSAGPSVASASGKKVSGINSVLKNCKATLTPIFGSENRLVNMSRSASAAFEKANIDASAFYLVEAPGNLNAVAKALLNDGLVEAAYVKPPAEAPVMIDESTHMSAPSTDDAPPITPNFNARQIYLDASPAGIDSRYAHTLAGGKGNGTRIIDIEGAWRFTHEDLMANQGGVIAGTSSTDLGWRNHGTAVIGEFGGDENNFGIVGICPAANTRAISIFGAGMGSANAIRRAADALGAGDIILIELHRPGPRHNFAGRSDQLGYIAVEWWPDDYAAILYAVNKGVIVVEAAGNGAENLSDALYNTRPAGFPASWRNPFNTANPTSNAVVVGAGAPPPGTHGRNHGPDRSRLGFSNYGARVDVQGWGREVTTCGYGDLQGGLNEDFWYTDTFSGTSSASPIVVGALGSIQGRLRNRSKALLTPTTARNLLRTTGSPQQDAPGRPATQRIGNRPNLRQAFAALDIGGIVKIFKEKDFKDAVKDIKEKDIKEGKELVKEVKEKDRKEIIKEKDLKEFKEGKELVKEVKEKDFKEREKHFDVGGGFGGGFQPSSPDAIEERMQNIENSLQQLSHFISAGNRPDLQANLFNQGDVGENDFEKNSVDAKSAKDDKDIETM